MLKGLFPQAYIVRVDRDTTSKKKDFQRVLKEIEEKTANIIVGTQMVSKGHNYPHINLAVVASFESLLSSPDVRATEKAVSLIIQVAGRAGKVIIQSLNPDNPLFRYVKKYDWRTFAEQELKNRKDLLYPPFTHLIRFVFRGRGEKKLREQAQKFAALLKEKIKREIIYGPVKAPIYMIKNEYRYHILIKTDDVKNTLKKINESQKKIQYNIRTICDVDPMNFL
jgi:primosomal protein N' (replication factor Y)